ncbi:MULTISPECIES: MarR family winged helix-turn-helix transcriptional regulator [Arthrobacter]|uniref:MarR family winged helix-turn-helix transcriptional regulator n=1 Tax=Arthrobacter TaxID=1663 RepID=UPI00068E58E3|nr:MULTISPECIES: MarR family transcriptional regulator [Arthrobacter]
MNAKPSITDPGAGRTGYPGEDADTDAAIEALEQQLSMLWRRARSNSYKVARRVHPDMEPAAYGLLVILQREGSMRLTDIAASVGVGKPSVSRQIAMLEQLGLVRKEADPLDGRAQSISLTDAGTRQLVAAQTARKQAFHQLMEDWDVEDLTRLGTLIAQLNNTYTRDNW